MTFHTHGIDVAYDGSTLAETIALAKVTHGLPTLTYRVLDENGPAAGWPVVTFTTDTLDELKRFLVWYDPNEPLKDLLMDLAFER